MPTYEYHCEECAYTFDQFQKINDDPLTDCPKCYKKTLKRGPGGGIGLSFKGNGFYNTDYNQKNSTNTDTPSAGSCCPCGKNKGSCSS